MPLKRIFLALYALLLLGFFQYGFVMWQRSGDTLADAWTALTHDWLVLITFVDASQFTALVFVWLAFDLRRQPRSRWEKLGWFALTLWLGAPVVMLYLAFRRQPRLV